MARRKDPRKQVMDGLHRLAFESAAEQLQIIPDENGCNTIALSGLDLFHITELRQVKGGGVEVKFYDRVKAMEKLYDLAKEEDGTLLRALQQGAQVWEEQTHAGD